MSFATGHVSDDAGDSYRLVEYLVADQQGCDAAHRATRIDHHDHWTVQGFCQCGIAIAAIEIESVMQALVTFNQANLCVLAAVTIIVDGFLFAGDIKIEVITGLASRHSKPDRIDIVRTFFKWLNHETSFNESRAQADTERGFA